jgi:hypothetical protein
VASFPQRILVVFLPGYPHPVLLGKNLVKNPGHHPSAFQSKGKRRIQRIWGQEAVHLAYNKSS